MKKNRNHFSNGLRSFGNVVLGLFSPKKRKEQVEEQEKNLLEEASIESPWRSVVRKFIKNPLGIIGLVGFIAVFLIVFVGSTMIPFDPFYSAGPMRNTPPGKGYMDVPQSLLDEGVEDIQTGITFSVGLSKEGNIFFWGVDGENNLTMPEEVREQIGDQKIKQIAVGDRHILVVTDSDQILGWGNNSFDQTVIPSDIQSLVEREGGVQKIGAGDQYSVVLTNEGTIKVWGSTLPNRLNLISRRYDKNVKDFATGSVNIMLVTKNNEIEVIGSKGSELDTAIPEELANGEVEVVQIARSQRSGSVIDADGNLWAWGSAAENIRNAPDLDEKAIQIAGGREHSLVLTESGKVHAWGKHDQDVTKVPEDDGYQRIFAGFYNNFAMKDESTYTSWGLDGYLMGTDQLGRDLFTRLIHGGKATLQISFIAIVIQILIGVVVGMLAGYYGGWVDNALMRFSEIIASFPFYPTIITLSATIPPTATPYQRILLVMVLLGILSWTGIARLVRGQILAEREKDYITAARALGLREGAIMSSHILPNILSIIIVQATLGYAGNLLSEAGLSFLGFGVPEPNPSWGNMMTSAQSSDVIEMYWWRWVFPGMAVFLTALTVNLIGDALRDALDPKSLER